MKFRTYFIGALAALMVFAPLVASAADFTGKIKRVRIKKRRVGSGYRVSALMVGGTGSTGASASTVELTFDEPFEGPVPQENPLSLAPTDEGGSDTETEFALEALEFDDAPEGLAYLVTATILDAKGQALAEPQSFDVVVESADIVTNIDTTIEGNVVVAEGETVVIGPKGKILGDLKDNGHAGANVEINGGTVTGNVNLSGGGTLKMTDATVGGNLRVKNGLSSEINAVGVGGNATLELLSIVTSGTVAAGGKLVLKSEGSSTHTGFLDAVGNITLDAGADLTVDGSVTSGARFRATAGGNFISNLPVLMTAETNINIQAGGTAALQGTLKAGDDLKVKAATVKTKKKLIDGDDKIFVSVRGKVVVRGEGINLIGGIKAQTDVVLRNDGNGGLTINGDIRAEEGEILLRNDGNGGLVVNDVLEAGVGDIFLRNDGDGGLIISGDIRAEEGDIFLRSDGNGGLVVNDVISAEGDVDIDLRVGDGNGGLVVNDVINAEGNVDIDFRSDGNGGLVVNDVINAEGNIDLQMRGGGDGGLIISGDVNASVGEIFLRGAGSTTVDGTVNAGANVTIDAGESLTVNGTVTAGTDVYLLSVTTFGGKGAIEAPGGVFFCKQKKGELLCE